MPILQSISGFLQRLQVPFAFKAHVNRQQQFTRNKLQSFLAEARKPGSGGFDGVDIDALQSIRGLGLPSTLGEAFCALRGRPMTAKERMANSCQGGLSMVAQDLFNKDQLSASDIEKFIADPQPSNTSTAAEKLLLQFYTTLLACAPDAALMQQQTQQWFYVQLLCRQQAVPGLGYELMKDITLRKGGETMLLYRLAFNHPVRNGEHKMLYALGGVVQLTHDIFQMHEDHRRGEVNIATTTSSVKELRRYYAALLEVVVEAAYRCGYPKRNVQRFLGLLSLSVFGPCFVQMRDLEKTEKRSKGVFDINAHSKARSNRNEEKRPGIFPSLKYLFIIPRRKRKPIKR